MNQEPKSKSEKEHGEDILPRVRKLLDRLEKPDKETGAARFFNSSFVVTCLGGILVAAIGWGLQTMTSHHDREMLEVKQAQDNKAKVAFDFANSFPLTLDITSRFRSREIWLQDPARKKAKQPYRDGRSFEETQKYYEACVDQYLSWMRSTFSS